MILIPHTTRTKWKTKLSEENGLETSIAKNVVNLVSGDPHVAAARPQSREELEQAIMRVKQALDDMNLAAFEEIEDHSEVRNELMEILKADLGIDQKPQDLITRLATGESDNRERDAEALGWEVVEAPEKVLELSLLTRETLQPLTKSVQTTEGAERRNAARVLGEVVAAGDTGGIEDAKDKLSGKLQDTSGKERAQIAKALGELEAISDDTRNPRTTEIFSTEQGEDVARTGLDVRGGPADTYPEELENLVQFFESELQQDAMALEHLEIFYKVVQWVEQGDYTQEDIKLIVQEVQHRVESENED